jgi:hypothetical protein
LSRHQVETKDAPFYFLGGDSLKEPGIFSEPGAQSRHRVEVDMKHDRRVGLCCVTAVIQLHATPAVTDSVSNEQLYRSGMIGLSRGNCVKAARYFFACLLRESDELRVRPEQRAKHP